MEDRTSDRRRAPRRPGPRLGRILGFPVHLNPSVLVFAALITLTYGGYVGRTLRYTPSVSYLVGFGFVVCLLSSVLLHELGHAVTARAFGIGVRGITLELLGGYTEMDRDAPTPRVDLLVALAGPAVSLVLGLAAAAGTAALPAGSLWREVAFQLAVSNLVVAVFNSLPGLPLDGGRALRAGVWAVSRDRHLGTEVAGWVGRVVAGLTALAAAVLAASGRFSVLGLVFLALVALTLWQGAGQAIRSARISRRFPLVDLHRLARPLYLVPAGTPLAEARRRADAAGQRGAALGVADAAGRLVAVEHAAAAEAVPPERRPWVAVEAVARGVDALPVLSPALAGEDVIRAVQANPVAEYLVATGEDVRGVLRLDDLTALLDAKGTRP